jgi:DNA-binding beta-propeller fold protein YncE
MMRTLLRFAVCSIALVVFFAPRSWSQNLYATSESFGQLVEVNMATGVVTTLYNIGFHPDSLIVDPQGRILYTSQNNGTLYMFDPKTGLNTVIAAGFSYPRDLIFDPSGTTLLVANFGVGAIDRVNLVTGTVTPLLKKQFTVDGLAYTPAGELFAVVNKHTQVVQLNPTTGAILNSIELPTPHNIGWYGFDGMTYDSFTGELWVSDVGVGADCLVEIPTNLSTYTLYQVGNLLNPDGIVSDGQGNLYIGVNLQKVYEYNIPTNTVTKIVKVKSVDDIALVPTHLF